VPDYNLGRAHGKIEIDYDGSGAERAAKDLDRVEKSSTEADESLSKTQKTLRDTDRQLDSSGSAAELYSARLRLVRDASAEVERAEQARNRTLVDSKATIDDVKRADDDLANARKRHTQALSAERDAHRDLLNEMNIGQRVVRGLSDLLPSLHANLSRIGSVQQDVSQKTTTLAKGLGVLAKGVAFLGPEGKAAAVGLNVECLDSAWM